MNKDFVANYRAILWKELMETIRTSKAWLPYSILMVIGFQFLPIRSIMQMHSVPAELKLSLLANISFYIPLMMIPFFGNHIVLRSIYTEKTNTTIQTLMASGICPSVIFIGKFSIAAAIAYASSFVALIGYCVLVTIYTGSGVPITFNMLYCTLFVIPVIALGILSLVSVAYLWLRDARILAIVLPMIIVLGGMSASMHFNRVTISALTSVVTLGAGVAMIALSFIWARAMSKERIASV